MKLYINIFLTAFLSLTLFGCQPHKITDSSNILTIGNYELTQEEFEQRFSESSYALREDEEAREDFLQNFVNQRIMILEAQSQRLDKNKEFLQTIERYWEQALIKEVLETNADSILNSISVSDTEIQNYFKEAREGGAYPNTPLSDVKASIEIQLKREKQNRAITEWIDQLKNKYKISVNQDLLKR